MPRTQPWPRTPEQIEKNRIARKRWYEENREKQKKLRKLYEAANRERVREWCRAYYARNREKLVSEARDKRGQDPRVAEARAKRELFKEHPWARNLFWKYRHLFTWPEFLAIKKRLFNGPCDLCGITKNGDRKRFYIDHDHATEKFRGILCHNCNVSLGHVRDNVSILKKAIAYLERSTTGV